MPCGASKLVKSTRQTLTKCNAIQHCVCYALQLYGVIKYFWLSAIDKIRAIGRVGVRELRFYQYSPVLLKDFQKLTYR